MRVHWFRRDLRLSDNPALNAAAEGGEVLGLFVLDPALLRTAGRNRLTYLFRSLRALDDSMDGRLAIRTGRPRDVVAALADEHGFDEVHASADFTPYGQRRDAAVSEALARAGRRLVTTGSPYAVSPGRILKRDGTPFQVYSPFYRAWVAHGWRSPAPLRDITWVDLRQGAPLELPAEVESGATLPAAGEAAAWATWETYLHTRLAGYHEVRNRPDLDATSRLSVHLRWGEIHPRSLLADLGEDKAHEVFRRELAWREFYADVLAHHPGSAREDLKPNGIAHNSGPEAEEHFRAWAEGRTGYPIVDAGMRQLRSEGWMHNRVRMIVASFLVKDLHLPWWRGAEEFMRWLVDGDLASNAHGWQWTAGTGTDAAPYFRIFNPTSQGERFDPDGDYVRRYVPELAHVPGAGVHTPWERPDGYRNGYPRPIVDHAAERTESLRRYEAAKAPP